MNNNWRNESIEALFHKLDGKKSHIMFHLRLKSLNYERLAEKVSHHYTRELLTVALEELEREGFIQLLGHNREEETVLEYGYTADADKELKPLLYALWTWGKEQMELFNQNLKEEKL